MQQGFAFSGSLIFLISFSILWKRCEAEALLKPSISSDCGGTCVGRDFER